MHNIHILMHKNTYLKNVSHKIKRVVISLRINYDIK